MGRIYLIFFGPPGSGKGTQVNKLAEILGFQVICPGILLRHEVEIGSVIGKKAKPIMDKGNLVPSTVVEELIDKYSTTDKAQKGVIFDGYPRSQEQFSHLIKRLKAGEDNNKVIYAILIDVSDKEVMMRLGDRRVCNCGAAYHLKFKAPKKSGVCDICGNNLYIRDDDKLKVIKDRLNLYHKQTKLLLNYFETNNRLIKINGEQSIEKVHHDINKELNQRGIIYDNN